MKKLNIGIEIKDFKGMSVGIVGNQPMKVQDALLQQIGTYRSATPKDTYKNMALGMKIAQCEQSEIELEDTEYEHLKKVVEERPAQVIDVVIYPVLMELERAENKAVQEDLNHAG